MASVYNIISKNNQSKHGKEKKQANALMANIFILFFHLPDNNSYSIDWNIGAGKK